MSMDHITTALFAVIVLVEVLLLVGTLLLTKYREWQTDRLGRRLAANLAQIARDHQLDSKEGRP